MEFPSKDRQADFAWQRQRSQPDLGSAAEAISQGLAVATVLTDKKQRRRGFNRSACIAKAARKT
jgi:hypothetical protein